MFSGSLSTRKSTRAKVRNTTHFHSKLYYVHSAWCNTKKRDNVLCQRCGCGHTVPCTKRFCGSGQVVKLSPPSSRQNLIKDNYLEDKRKIIRTVLCCIVYDSCVQWYAHTREQILKLNAGYGRHVELGRPLYFCPVISIFFFFFYSPNLSGRRLDDYHTSTHDVALVRI